MPELPNIAFSLAEQPCVPVLDANAKPQRLSLRDTLNQAHTLKELSHTSPVVTASLVRLLVAILADIFEPHNLADWQRVWTQDRFDTAKVDAYFQKYADRFDLFHPKYPFYQAAELQDENPVNLNLFAAEKAGGNNPTLFDHSLDTVENDYTPVEAFYLLLATQNFALAGLLRRTTKLNGEEIYWQSAYSAPLIPGAMIWLTGDNLFETLALNLVPIERMPDEETDDETPHDMPVWRLNSSAELRDRQVNKTTLKEPSRGTRDRLSWQSRLVRLLPERTDTGEIVVRRACYNFGRSADNGQNQYDSMLAYRAGKKEGMLVVRLSSEKAVWRDAHALFGVNSATKHTPDVMQHLANAIQKNTFGLEATRRLRLNVAGLANDQAKILLWRHDRLDAPAGVLSDSNKAAKIGALLQEAEDVAGYLRAATRKLCEIFLAPLKTAPNGKQRDELLGADTDRITSLADSIDPRPVYWARLESHFASLLLGFATEEDAASEAWRKQVQRQARLAFDEGAERLGDDSIKVQKAVAFINTSFLVPSNQPKKPVSKS